MLRFIRDRQAVIIIILLIAVPLAVFGPVMLRSEFVSLDDTLLITENPAAQELTPRSVFTVFTSYDPELYVPLTLFSYQIESVLFGVHPVAFHFGNLFLHIGSAIILFLLCERLLKNRMAAGAVALLFAIHPLQTEAVLWAAARKDVLSTFFFLLTLFLYERSRESHARAVSTGSVVSFALALLSKVTVLPLPLVLLLLDWHRGERITWRSIREKWPYFGLAFVFAVIAAFGKRNNLASLTALQYLLVAAKSTVFYLQKLLWPAHLSVAYPQNTVITLSSPEFLVPVLLVCLLIVVMFFLLRLHRAAALGLLFFALTLPVNFFNVWKNGYLFFASDRYAYIPSIGIFVALVSLAFSCRCGIARRAAPVITAILIAVLSVTAAVQARTWMNSESLYTKALSAYPDSSLLLVNLGDVYVRSGRTEEGLAEFEKAIAANPGNILALTNAGNLFKQRGDFTKAKQYYTRAVEALPERPFVEHLIGHYLLGELLLQEGKTEQGFAVLEEATVRGAQYAEPFFNLGIMQQRYGRSDAAMGSFEKSVENDSGYIAARYHLAGLYAERGRLVEAKNHLEYVVSVDPGYEKAMDHLAAIRGLLRQ